MSLEESPNTPRHYFYLIDKNNAGSKVAGNTRPEQSERCEQRRHDAKADRHPAMLDELVR